MRAWQISSFGIDNLEFAERPDPEPGPGQVIVRIHAISLNYRDLLMVRGLYNPKLKLPRIPCSDGAGEVVAAGPEVTMWKRGDRVAGIFMQNWIDGPPTPDKVKGALGGDIDGTLAEYVALSETGLVPIPDHLSFQEAATLPCAAVTAWNALNISDVKPGATVLIQGTGGVSIFALQFARLRGAKVLGISGSHEKLHRAYELGLDGGLNYNETPEWDRWAMEQTGDGVIGHSTTAGHRWTWQTKAWSHGQREPTAVLYQEVVNSPSNPGPLLGGIHVDIDEVLATDFGQWDLDR